MNLAAPDTRFTLSTRLISVLFVVLVFSIVLFAATPAATAGSMSLDGHVRKGTPWGDVMHEDLILEYFVEHVNSNFSLPADLRLTVADCTEPNAFYDPEQPELVICTELLEMLHSQALFLAENDHEIAGRMFLDALMFTLFHEFGHAAVDLFNIPFTGREEDVADQVAVWAMLNAVWEKDMDAVSSTLAAAEFFTLQDLHVHTGEQAYWDAHSLDEQRFYNILCWTYGAHPRLTEIFLDEPVTTVLDEERAVTCEEEYVRMADSLFRLMTPHFKD